MEEEFVDAALVGSCTNADIKTVRIHGFRAHKVFECVHGNAVFTAMYKIKYCCDEDSLLQTNRWGVVFELEEFCCVWHDVFTAKLLLLLGGKRTCIHWVWMEDAD